MTTKEPEFTAPTSIGDCLHIIQQELKAPKNQFNAFGKYKYRNCEDILEAVKPLLEKTKCTLIINDDLVEMAGNVYVKATAMLSNGEGGLSSSSYARESVVQKGMNDAQITGSTSTYARKYALNGLFLIDDTKDADSRDNQTIDTNPVDMEKVDKATSFFVDMINADVDETEIAPKIQAAFHRLSSDEQIAVNENLKGFKFEKRQMNTILKGFLDFHPEPLTTQDYPVVGNGE